MYRGCVITGIGVVLAGNRMVGWSQLEASCGNGGKGRRGLNMSINRLLGIGTKAKATE